MADPTHKGLANLPTRLYFRAKHEIRNSSAYPSDSDQGQNFLTILSAFKKCDIIPLTASKLSRIPMEM
jgi:hypothetical protein